MMHMFRTEVDYPYTLAPTILVTWALKESVINIWTVLFSNLDFLLQYTRRLSNRKKTLS